MKLENNLVTVIIPIFNEYEGIPLLVKSLNDFFAVNDHLRAEVIFVNDGSSDSSALRLSDMEHKTYLAKAIHLSRNFGYHTALREGIANVFRDFISFNYVDLQDSLELITEMKARMMQRNDLVWAHRKRTTVSMAEKTFSKDYAYLMRKFAFKNFP